MTVQTDLQTALDAYIQANYSGSLAEVSAAKKPLEDLLQILDTVTTSGGGGGSITNYALETGGNLANIALATGVDNATIPARTVLVGGQHDGKIENIKVDQTGAIVVNATGQQSSADSFSVVLASNQPAITVTANAGTNLNTSTLALESGGNLAGINTKLPASLGAKTAANSLSVTQAFAATSTLANVASSATSVSLLAANNNRKTAIIINDSTSDLYVTLNASAASTTNYSLFLAAKVGNTPSFLAINGDDYSGEIRGIWSSANGFARITEIV